MSSKAYFSYESNKYRAPFGRAGQALHTQKQIKRIMEQAIYKLMSEKIALKR